MQKQRGSWLSSVQNDFGREMLVRKLCQGDIEGQKIGELYDSGKIAPCGVVAIVGACWLGVTEPDNPALMGME